jgi:hypothetical protein
MQVPIALVLGQSCTPHPVLDTACSPNSPMANSGGPSIVLHSTLIISHDCDLGGYLNPCANVPSCVERNTVCREQPMRAQGWHIVRQNRVSHWWFSAQRASRHAGRNVKVVQYFPRIADCQHNAYTTVSVRGVSQVVG